MSQPDSPAPHTAQLQPHLQNALPASTELQPPLHLGLDELFREQVRLHADKTAIVEGERRLTYSELDAAASHLAARLADLGLQPGAILAICLERSIHNVVAMLAASRLAVTYAPLDPSYPAERRQAMLEDLGFPWVISHRSLLANLVPQPERLLWIDEEAAPQAAVALPTVPPALAAAIPAVIFFTSGSTGRPKGVVMPQKGIVRLVRNNGYLEVRPEDVLSHGSNISFDAALFEIWGGLLNGATVVICSQETLLSPTALLATYRQHGVSISLQTAALFQHHIRTLPELFDSLRAVLFGGERCDPEALRLLLARTPRPQLFNCYGPTEATCIATTWLADELAPEAVSVPIGRPIAATDAHVLSRELEPVPLGDLGQLALGGEALAFGYQKRPAQTAERFVPDPFSGRPGARLYLTGDLVRLLPNLQLDFVGRTDHQIKLRGFRIETAEIEAALTTLPGVDEALVMLREDRPGDKRLVAYWSGIAQTKDDLLAGLRERLPEFMLPSDFVWLARLPLDPNGKIDRRALPAPNLFEPQSRGGAPEGPFEQGIATIWAETLGVQQVGRDDHFFDLGGHSLSAGRLLARLVDWLGAAVPLRLLFDAPRLQNFAAALQERLLQSDDGRRRLASLEAGEADGQGQQLARHPAGIEPLAADTRRGRLPLSFAQERMWLLDLWQPGSTAYNMPFSYDIVGRLEPKHLEQALLEILERHESLRTVFRAADGVPYQEVQPATLPRLEFDLSSLSAEEKEIRAAALVAELMEPFDLANSLPLRARLLRLQDDHWRLAFCIHHIVFDGWSAGIFFRELSVALGAATAGHPSGLPALSLQYADYAAWQRASTGNEEREIAYWRRRLAHAEPLLALPTDRLRVARKHRSSQGVVARLPGQLVASLKALAAARSAPLFPVLMAAYQILLHRLAGQNDILVGIPVATRPQRELEPLIGVFLNTLVIRGQLSPERSFADFFDEIRDRMIEAHENQTVPFERLLQELDLERNTAATPVFQVMLNLINVPGLLFEWPGLEVRPISQGGYGDEAKFDLNLYIYEGEDFTLNLVYDRDLFDRARMADLLEQFVQVLDQAVSAPDRKIGDFSLLTASARQRLPDPKLPLPGAFHGTLVDFFLARCAERPEHPAVEDPQGVYSYRFVEEHSRRLAAALLEAGVKRGDVVSIWAHRSADIVIAMYGILRAGAAFTMLDPAYPEARLRLFLELAGSRAVVLLPGAGPLPEKLSSDLAERGIPLVATAGLPETTEHSDELVAQACAVGPDDLCYVAFTSGSTGRPKAVLGRHTSMTAFYTFWREAFGLNSEDRASMFSALTHDPLHRDVFVTLGLGATVVAPDPEVMLEPEYLAHFIDRQRITVVNMVPAMLQVLLEGGAACAGWPSLRRVFTVGEVLQRKDVDTLYRLAENATCINLYGATETQRALSYVFLPRDLSSLDPESETGTGGMLKAALPVGRGMDGMQLILLNDALEQTGVGEVGEVHVRTAYLARGYAAARETAAAFVPNPFGSGPADRFYRTGDLGRYLPDGQVELLGRADSQVKIRGYRIELQEIEAFLLRHPSLMKAVVIVREDIVDGGEKTLVAYYVLREGQLQPSRLELRAHLLAALPDYMVPAIFEPLSALPLTDTGKVNRRGLPRPNVAATEKLHRPPFGPHEEVLAAIWSPLLGVAEISRDDDFFALGGHSLLATRLLSRIRDTFGVSLPLRQVFDEPTLEALAARIATSQQHKGPEISPLRPLGSSGPLPLSFAQQRIFFLERLEPGTSAYVLSSAFRIPGPLAADRLEKALGEVVARHSALRSRFLEVDGNPVQVIDPPRPFVLPRLGPLSEAELLEHLERFGKRPFDLASDLMLRAELLEVSAEEHVLAMAVHHIATDGWSNGLIVAELKALYRAPGSLPPLDLQFADYAVWQQQNLVGERLEHELNFFREHLAEAPPFLTLATDYPRPALQSFRGAKLHLQLDAELVKDLRRYGSEHGATLFMVLLSAWAATLSRFAGQEQVVVGTPIAGREDSALEKVVGFFANTLPLHIDLRGRPGFAELTRRVRELSLDAFAHQNVPFEKLVAELVVERHLAFSPIFQNMFALQHVPRSTQDPGDLPLLPMVFERDQALFDVTLSLIESHGAENGEVFGWLEYNTDLFHARSATVLLQAFENLLRSALRDVQLPIDHLDLLGPEPPAEPPVAPRQDLPDVVAAILGWAEKNPDTPALVFGEDSPLRRGGSPCPPSPTATGTTAEKTLTYGELEKASRALAANLRQYGVGAPGQGEVAVAILAERSPEAVVAQLAVLRAGGYFVPLHPDLPEARQKFILGDRRCAVVFAAEKPQYETTATWLPLTLPEYPGETAEALPLNPATPDQLAYAIFTSGSTGQPKAVGGKHSAVAALVAELQDLLPIKPGDRCAWTSNPAFDVSIAEVFGALARGGTLAIAPEADKKEAQVYFRWLQSQQIHLAEMPAPFLSDWLRELEAGAAHDLHGLTVGTEPIPHALLLDIRRLMPATRIWNFYGPTETTVECTAYEVPTALPAGATRDGKTPIGRALASTRTRVVDRFGQKVPPGVLGELWIGGAGVTRGYLGQPRLTAEKFLPDAESSVPGARLYRSGDLVRELPTGELEFAGRIDDQLKIRGFRIEPGETEAALGTFPGIREVAVLARPGRDGQPMLVAFVATENPLEVPTLRQWALERLPEYQVPTVFVLLTSLPRTPSGKIDTRALKVPLTLDPAKSRPAATPMERELAALVAGVLGLESPPGMEEDFFQLGGHSLLAAKLVARVRERWAVDLPLRELFRFPNLGDLAERLLELRALPASAGLPVLRPTPAEQKALLSPGQRRLFFLQQLSPSSTTYNVPLGLELRGKLDVPAFLRAFEELVLRHEILRTRYPNTEHEALVVENEVPAKCPFFDLRALPATARQQELEKIERGQLDEPFNLTLGPIYRAALVQLEDDTFQFLLTVHHIATDGWSMDLLLLELAKLYGAFRHGEASPLPALPLRYSDHAAWLEECLSGERYERLLEYWRTQLQDLEPLELPAEKRRPPVFTERGASLGLELDRELTARLRHFLKERGETLFVVVAAIFEEILGRFTYRSDVAIGTVSAGRQHLETEGIVGFFVNTLVLRTSLQGEPSLLELMRRTRLALGGALDHQLMPFDKLTQELRPERDPARHPLVQVFFQTFEEVEPVSFPDLETRPIDPTLKTAHFDLNLSAVAKPDTILLGCNYYADLLSAELVQNLLAAMAELLRLALLEPTRPLAQLAAKVAPARQAVLRAPAHLQPPLHRSLDALFREQVQLHADKPALLDDTRSLTYAELDAAAERFAARLESAGALPGSRVAICLERSIENVVAILAATRLGLTYAPLDRNYPVERRQAMLDDLATGQPAPLVITNQALRATFEAAGEASQLVLIDEPGEEGEEHPRRALPEATLAAIPAVIFFTSGSTGRPKGVVVPQQGIVRLVRNNGYLDLGPDTVLAHASNISFDAALFEIWGALLNGGRIYVCDQDTLLSGQQLTAAYRHHGVTTTFQTTALFQHHIRTNPELFDSLHAVLFGGERCDPEALRLLLGRSPRPQLIHCYGPTETVCFATTWRIDVLADEATSVPIGTPIAETHAQVLGRDLMPVPPGALGQLALGGAGLALAYLARPAQSAERFVPDPFSGQAGARLYLTGDLVRLLPNGLIDFVGRTDHQIKLRGFRIEIGEIEAALASLPGVEEVLVMLREDRPGDPRLVAYWSGAARDKAELLTGLRAHLPEFMLPSDFIWLPRLPLNANGKVDRQALPVPLEREPETKRAAATPMERELAELVAGVLGLESPPGMNEDFFQLGGHSLLAAKLVARVRERFAVDLPLRELFRFPNLGDLAGRLLELRALPATADLPALRPAPAAQKAVLSPGQRRMFFLQQLSPSSTTYNVPLGLELRGALDLPAFLRAFEELVRRHEILRTRYPDTEKEALVVEGQVPASCQFFDLRALPATTRQQELEKIERGQFDESFDLVAGPVYRAALVQLEDDTFQFLLTVHHIATDGWSMDLLLLELATLYGAFHRGEARGEALGETSPLPALPLRYSDYAAWLAECLSGERYDRLLEYWRSQLQDLEPLELPAEKRRPPVFTERGASLGLELDRELTATLRQFLKERGETLFVVVAAIFEEILGRFTYRSDVAIGTVSAGRQHLETEGIVGFFVNTLVLRTSLAGEPSLLELMRRTRLALGGALDHQLMPFDRLTLELRPERDPARHPLVQVFFQTAEEVEPVRFPDLETRPAGTAPPAAHFDLSLMAMAKPDTIRLGCSYYADLLSAELVQNLLTAMADLLRLALREPYRPLAQLAAKVEPARQAVLRAPAHLHPPLHRSLDALFREQVQLHGDKPALLDDTRSLTYAELDAAAERFAARLESAGAVPGSRVAICLERSIENVVAILAATRLGLTYAPLDRNYPAERRQAMLDDLATGQPAPLVITNSALRATFEATGEAPQLVLIDEPGDLDQHPRRALPEAILAAIPAVIFFTSGSTGRPKGVVVPQQGIVRLVRNNGYIELGPDTVLAHASNISFDAALFEIWGALLNGGRLYVCDQDTLLSGQQLTAAYRRHGVTTTFQTTALFQHHIRTTPELFDNLREVLFGGERCDPEALRLLLGRSPRPQLIHCYGPTETVCFATTWRIDAVADEAMSVPIGTPIAETHAQVLGRDLMPVPPGALGQLALGGAGLALGYLARPAQSAERFVPDPFSGQSGARLYLTGDLVRLLPNGLIDFVGRTDHQIKLRGFRIEIGEIEAALASLPGVEEVLVMLREDRPGDPRLAAYWSGAARDKAELLAGLREHLPEFMLPSDFIWLPRLPLNANGKVDRRALPVPVRLESEGSGEAPRDAFEAGIAAIWAETLGVDEIRRDDQFFDRGGHSLIAGRLRSRLTEWLGFEIPLRLLFDAPRLADFAAGVRERLENEDKGRLRLAQIDAGDALGLAEPSSLSAAIPVLAPEVRRGRLPLSFAQERMWLLDLWQPGSTAYHMPFVFDVVGRLESAHLELALREMLERHESLRVVFGAVDGVPYQEVREPALPPLEFDLRDLPPEEKLARAESLVAELMAPFDLASSQLLRARLIRLEDGLCRLAFCFHHIVFDGWSTGIFFRELGVALAAAAAGKPSGLPTPSLQYTDYAAWQRASATTEEREREIAYWRQRLANAEPLLALPTDRLRVRREHRTGALIHARLPGELVARLKAFAATRSAPLFPVLMAAFQILLHRLAGQNDILVGIPVVTRPQRELEPLIGLFLNTLVIRGQIDAQRTFEAFFDEIRDRLIEAHENQTVPFERLLQELAPERNTAATPIFQVMLNLANLPDLGLDWPGFEIRTVPLSGLEAKFDLNLYIFEGDDYTLQLVYDSDLFDRARMFELLDQYSLLLDQAVSAPARRLRDFSLRTARAQRRLPDPANELAGDFRGPWVDHFLARCAERPDHPAIEDRSTTISYGRLEERSRRLAAGLIAAGVNRGDVVAVWAHRSADLAVAMLGVLRAGAAFTFLDPGYPEARLLEYISLAEPRALVLLPQAGALPAAVVAAFDQLGAARLATAELPATAPETGVDPDIGPDDLSHIAFTSGSTGRPKAVLGRHAALTAFMPFQRKVFGLDAEDRHSLLSALTHDPLHRDVLIPLVLGATVVVPDPEQMFEPGYLARWTAERRITVTNMVPAMLQLLLQGATEAGFAGWPSLRRVFTVGDVLQRTDVDALYTLSPQATCINLYGATETQRALSYVFLPRDLATLDPEDDDGTAGLMKAALPVGRGMDGLQLILLRPNGGQTGIGEVGEIHFRSAYLARGYASARDTAAAFLPNPYGQATAQAERFYRTGDLGRYLPDGQVELLGRADSQIKIRGYRIELQEIEAVLLRHPALLKVVAIVRDDVMATGEKTLVAYYVLREHHEKPSRVELRAHLLTALPDYMVPAIFEQLEALPLTDSGKINRRALPKPSAETTSETSHRPPLGPHEEILAAIWSQLLGVSPIGRDDDFFALGGHSLIATRLLSRIRDTFGVVLQLRQIFDEPTVEALAARIAAHERDGQELRPQPRLEAAAVGSEEGSRQPSFGEQRMWFLQSFDPASTVYNMGPSLELRGHLDTEAFARALAEVLRRHEVLRSTYAQENGELRVHRTPVPAEVLQLHDVSALPEADQKAAVAALLDAEAQKSFDLAKGPICRFHLARIDEGQHVFLATVHHIAFDGLSQQIFLRELLAIYRAFAAGEPSPLPPPALQYGDFASWQRQYLQGEELERQLAFWRRTLVDQPLELPTLGPRPAIFSHRGEFLPWALTAESTEALRAWLRQNVQTTYMALGGAFQAFLAHLCGQDSVTLGSPIAGRNRRELEDMVGFFANTLVLRTDLSGAPSFRQALERARMAALDAYAHQDLPFEKLVDALGIRRDASRNPIFQVGFQVLDQTFSVAAPEGLELRPIPVPYTTARFDLDLQLFDDGEKIAGALVFNPDLFSRQMVEGWMEGFQAFLSAGLTNPDSPLSELPLLPEAKKQELLNLPAATEVARENLEESVLQLFLNQAAEQPQAKAISFGNQHLSYGELAKQASDLAKRLREKGVRPEDRVGVLLERNLDLPVALLATWIAEAAYVPLDPAYPADRLRYMVEAASCKALISTQALTETLALPTPIPLVEPLPLPLLERGTSVAQNQKSPTDPTDPSDPSDPSDNNPPNPQPETTKAPNPQTTNPTPTNPAESLAYVLFTSGSTGKPKGVMVSHGNLSNFVRSMAQKPGCRRGDILLSVTTVSFDIFGLELYLPLATGAQIELASRDTAGDGQLLAARIDQVGATLMQATPATWRVLLDSGWQGRQNLRILCGGEALPAELAQRLLPKVAELWNVYGPTETTIWSALRPVTPADTTGVVPLGQPIANTGLYIVDRHGRLLPPSTPGELWIGGAGVARGYIGRGDLSAERFVPDPFAATPGQRAYRTGDLVRRRESGELEFLGRIDHQVKIRGFRIELGEIEAVLARHPGLAEAVVVAKTSPAGGHRLVAYVVPRADEIAAEDLRAHCAAALPDYMVPVLFVHLAAMPLTPNNKVDRKALPEPLAGGARSDFEAPQGEVEEKLATIWREVLRIDQVGRQDSFFSLGGDSILVISAVTRARTTGLDLAVRDLFLYPDLQSLAAATRPLSDLAANPRHEIHLELSDEDLASILDEVS